MSEIDHANEVIGTRPRARSGLRRAHRLEGLLNPRSVAIIGASERNQYSNSAVDGLKRLGFDGAVHLVNRRGEAYGEPAAVNCAAIGEPVDAAYLCVPFEAILDTVQDAIAAGIGNLVIVSSGFAEVGGEGARREAELKAICEGAKVRLLGPNCLGYRNILDRVALGSLPFVYPQPTLGSIAVIAASGSVACASAMYGAQQGIGFSHLIAAGNETNVTVADLVDYLVDVPEVEAIALFLETVKDAGALAAAALRAKAARKPIVAIKAGSAPATAAIAAAHTNAIVGDDRVFDAACERLAIVRVHTFEEMVNTAAAMAATGPISPTGVAFVSISGGICEVASDCGASAGVNLPQFGASTRAELGQVLSELGQMNNPIDLTGAAVRDQSLWTRVPQIVSRDPAVGLTMVAWDLPAVPDPTMPETLDRIGECHKSAATPVLMLTNYQQPLNEYGRTYLDSHGLPFALSGIGNAMTAVGKLAWWSERLERPSLTPEVRPPRAVAEPPRDERETLSHLARHGVPVVPTLVARSASEAARAAREIGGPVVLKVLSPDIAHKSDVGGVVLNLSGPADVERAYDQMMRRVEAKAPQARIDGAIVAPMRTDGLELMVGVARDPQWGLVMALGLGGVWVEVLNDTVLSLLPADEAELVRQLRLLKAARLFDGYRGAPPVDLDAVARAAARIGAAAAALGPHLAALEVNPLYVRAGQVEALDALATWAPVGGAA